MADQLEKGMDKAKAQAMVFASFISDALALGPHWIYDPNEIVARFGRITGCRVI